MPSAKHLTMVKKYELYFYVSKAFDRVWHEGLLFKLRTVCISGVLLQLWFIYYLSNRKQQVVLPGVSSELSTLKAGVSQGSIFGPLLFLLYINDIVENIDCSTRLFADDTCLYIMVDDPLDTAQFSILMPQTGLLHLILVNLSHYFFPVSCIIILQSVSIINQLQE